MDYICTPEEAQAIAEAVKDFLQRQRYSVQIEKAITAQVKYRTTLTATRNHYSILVDAQHKPEVDQSLTDLIVWLLSNSKCAELFIATDRAASFSGKFFKALDNTGIGLIIVEEDGSIRIDRNPKNPALIVRPEPGLKYGKHSVGVNACLTKFNTPTSLLSEDNLRKDALRDLCEIVESQTEELGVLLGKKRFITCDGDAFRSLDWSKQINLLAATGAYNSGITPVVSDSLRTDLHSFRDARNKLDHKVRSKRAEIERQQQMPERMMMGPRLVADLVSISSSIQRKKALP